MKTKYFIFLVSVFLISCSKADQYESYLGEWKRTDTKTPEILSISMDGTTYLMDDDILTKTTFTGSQKTLTVLTVSDGNLVLSSPLGSSALRLSEDENKLYFSGKEYQRISSIDRDSIISNNDLCSSAKAAFVEESRKVSKDRSLGAAERQARLNEIQKERNDKVASIAGCG